MAASFVIALDCYCLQPAYRFYWLLEIIIEDMHCSGGLLYAFVEICLT